MSTDCVGGGQPEEGNYNKAKHEMKCYWISKSRNVTCAHDWEAGPKSMRTRYYYVHAKACMYR